MSLAGSYLQLVLFRVGGNAIRKMATKREQNLHLTSLCVCQSLLNILGTSPALVEGLDFANNKR